VRLAQRQIWLVVASGAHYFDQLMKDKDAEKSQRVMKAMFQMKKIDIPTLKQVYEGR
jgi:hypothetical protein